MQNLVSGPCSQVLYTRRVLSEEAACLDKLSRELKLPLSEEVSGRLLAFVSRLLAWNARINLTGARSGAELISEHLVDSFAMTRFLPLNSSLADIGAGGGLPGIPLAILRPDLRITMVEPRAKRVAFLRSAVHELGLQRASVLRCRSEEVSASSFDLCSSRATFPPGEWLEVGRSLVKRDGLVLVFANAPWAAADATARLKDSILYASGSGRSRWMGAFCFT